MDTQQKLELLSDASQYDLACACGSSDDDRRHRAEDGRWLYPVSLARGGKAVMLKTLLSNVCVNDCKYCPFRAGKDPRRCTIEPDEMAKTFLEYNRKHDLIGLFLSSGVIGTADNTMQKLNAVAEILRYKYRYRGFIHLKVIPGASDGAIDHALSLASTVSVNIEVPGARHVRALSEKKNFHEDIIRPIKRISRLTSKGNRYERVRQTTQFIVGAAEEKDSEIVGYMEGLYHRLGLERVYFSAYQGGLGEESLPGERTREEGEDILLREHRLYQTDFLMRQYGFSGDEISFDESGKLFTDRDPKQVWADTHPEQFPIRINADKRKQLLRVPGLGPITVRKITKMRKQARITDLSEVGIKGKAFEKVSKYVIFE